MFSFWKLFYGVCRRISLCCYEISQFPWHHVTPIRMLWMWPAIGPNAVSDNYNKILSSWVSLCPRLQWDGRRLKKNRGKSREYNEWRKEVKKEEHLKKGKRRNKRLMSVLQQEVVIGPRFTANWRSCWFKPHRRGVTGDVLRRVLESLRHKEYFRRCCLEQRTVFCNPRSGLQYAHCLC